MSAPSSVTVAAPCRRPPTPYRPLVSPIYPAPRTPYLKHIDAPTAAPLRRGFVFAGPRNSSLTVAPHATADLSFQLVALTAGEMLLPELVVTAPRFHAQLRPPRESRQVYVTPHLAPP